MEKALWKSEIRAGSGKMEEIWVEQEKKRHFRQKYGISENKEVESSGHVS